MCVATPISGCVRMLPFTTKQASSSSSIIHGGGKRRAEGMLHREARFLNPPFKFRSCNCQPWFRVISGNQGGNNYANLRKNRCDIRRCRRNCSRQRGASRSLVRLSSSLLPSSLWLLPSSLPSPALLRLLPLLPSSSSPSLLEPLVRVIFSALHRCSSERQLCVGLILLLRSDDLAFERSAFVMLPRDSAGARTLRYWKEKGHQTRVALVFLGNNRAMANAAQNPNTRIAI